MEIKTRKKCAICSSPITTVLNLGFMPLANHLLLPSELALKEKKYPLTLCFCLRCGLLQLGQIVSPDVMYKDYLYVPSNSKTLLNHFSELCEEIVKFNPKYKFVVDVGSNDGSLLKFFKKHGFKVLGVDPAQKIAEAANISGIKTLPFCFNKLQAKQISKKFGKADLVTATNVFAHIEDLYDLYQGVDLLLAPSGICVFEVSYLADMIQNSLFDSIYHEHLYYFSVGSLLKLFEKTNFEIFNIEKINMHGGSLRVWLKKKNNKKIKVKKDLLKSFFLDEERKGLYQPSTFFSFSKKIEKLRKKLVPLLLSLRHKKKSIVGFGAPAKGNILLNYFGIDKKILDYIVDSTSYKQFRYTPGNHLQVLPEETIYIERPDYLLVLAWNFSDEIVKKHKNFKGKFILPMPKIKIV